MDYTTRQEIYSGARGLNDPEEIEDCTCELLMRSSGPIGYRMKIFMKAVDGTAGPITIHHEMHCKSAYQLMSASEPEVNQ